MTTAWSVRGQLKPLLVVFSVTVALVGCASESKTKNESLPQLPSALVVAPSAVGFFPWTRRDGQIGVTYMVREEFPANGLFARIRTALPAPEWRPLQNDWLDPAKPSSHQTGWVAFTDGTKKPPRGIHVWLGQWQDSKGNIALYVLRYDSMDEKRSAASRNIPDNASLSVTAVWIPGRVAEHMMSNASRQRR
jgi:hypothetical protein